MSNVAHMGKRAFGSIDHFLTRHGANIKKIADAAAPVLATKGGPYGVVGAAAMVAAGEGASAYQAIRSQMT